MGIFFAWSIMQLTQTLSFLHIQFPLLADHIKFWDILGCLEHAHMCLKSVHRFEIMFKWEEGCPKSRISPLPCLTAGKVFFFYQMLSPFSSLQTHLCWLWPESSLLTSSVHSTCFQNDSGKLLKHFGIFYIASVSHWLRRAHGLKSHILDQFWKFHQLTFLQVLTGQFWGF